MNTTYNQNQPNEQSQLPKTDSLRQLQLYAEAHSIKGLCLEQKRSNLFVTNPNYKSSDDFKIDDQDIIDSFEISSLLAIQHSILMHQKLSASTSNISNINSATGASLVQATNINSNAINGIAAASDISSSLNTLANNDDNVDLINPLFEISLQKAPLLYIKKVKYNLNLKCNPKFKFYKF